MPEDQLSEDEIVKERSRWIHYMHFFNNACRNASETCIEPDDGSCYWEIEAAYHQSCKEHYADHECKDLILIGPVDSKTQSFILTLFKYR